MVTTGFSRIHVAKYTCSGGVSGYSGCRELARAKSMSTDITTTEENKFYANNQLAESEPSTFKEGKAKIVVDGLTAEEEAFILGIAESTVNTGTADDPVEVPVIAFGKSMNPPYLGIGGVKEMMLNGVTSYRPVILTKTRFAVPPEAGETREDKINWQTQELEADIMRDDTTNANWKIIPKTNYTTEEEAVDFIRALFGGVA